MKLMILGSAMALNSGLRDENTILSSAHEKAQGRCAKDSYTCPAGDMVDRDPSLSCRFAPCAGQTSLVEKDNKQPTYQWEGVSIADDQNFCTRMTKELSSYTDLSVTQCAGQSDCENHYVHVNDGNPG